MSYAGQDMAEKTNPEEVIFETLMLPGFALAFLGPLAVVGFQIFYWLKTGDWFPLLLVDASDYIGIDASGLKYTSDWRGLARAVLWVLELPLSLTIIGVGLALAFIGGKVREIAVLLMGKP